MKKYCTSQTKDRISYLTDPLRSHIVSFLPIEDAIRTSILSRRWEFVCASLSKLVFDQNEFEAKQFTKGTFRDFVDEMIFRHDGSDIERFTLEINDYYTSSRHIDAWISFAIQHNVQDLLVSRFSSMSETLKFPRRFFVGNTLVKLTLSSMRLEWLLVPYFPKLKYLALECLSFNGNTGQKLLSNCTCPILEDLSITECSFNIDSLFISIPSLKILKVIECNDPTFNVPISTLQRFECISYTPPNVIFDGPSSITNAKFDIMGSFKSHEIAMYSQYPGKILSGLCNVVKLTLTNTFLELLSVDQDLSTCLPTSNICSLKYLKLKFCATRVHLQVIKFLLRSYSNLQNVRISVQNFKEVGSFLKTKEVEEYCEVKELPSGDTLNCLRTVEVKYFKGKVIEVELVNYLLRHAKYMEKLNIISSRKLQHGNVAKGNRIDNAISTFTTTYPNVKISAS